MKMNDLPRQKSRSEILSRIQAAMDAQSEQNNPTGDWENLSRDYIRSDSLSGPAVLELFEHRLRDYGAHVVHSSTDLVRDAIGKVLADRQAKRLLIPAGIPADWLPPEISFTVDENLTYGQLDTFDGVLTTATIAIAATGTIVLQHGPGQGRRALSLIPDYHLCLVRADQVVETVPAAFAKLDSRLPTTFISGPSATADIEMTRIKGVHGPRFLDMILLH